MWRIQPGTHWLLIPPALVFVCLSLGVLRGFQRVLYGADGSSLLRAASPLAALTPVTVAPKGVLHVHLWSLRVWRSQPLLHQLT